MFISTYYGEQLTEYYPKLAIVDGGLVLVENLEALPSYYSYIIEPNETVIGKSIIRTYNHGTIVLKTYPPGFLLVEDVFPTVDVELNASFNLVTPITLVFNEDIIVEDLSLIFFDDEPRSTTIPVSQVSLVDNTLVIENAFELPLDSPLVLRVLVGSVKGINGEILEEDFSVGINTVAESLIM